MVPVTTAPLQLNPSRRFTSAQDTQSQSDIPHIKGANMNLTYINPIRLSATAACCGWRRSIDGHLLPIFVAAFGCTLGQRVIRVGVRGVGTGSRFAFPQRNNCWGLRRGDWGPHCSRRVYYSRLFKNSCKLVQASKLSILTVSA